jgi:hypothetical protein
MILTLEHIRFTLSVDVYRIHSFSSTIESLKSQLEDQVLTSQGRVDIQRNVYSLARFGRISFVDYLKLLHQGYKHEDDLTVWKSILRQLIDLNSIFDHASIDNTKILFQRYICNLLSNIYAKLGWNPSPNEDSETNMLRSLILIQMGINGYDEIRVEAHKRFEKLLIDDDYYQSIDANIRAAIYLIVAQTGNKETFEGLQSVIQENL